MHSRAVLVPLARTQLPRVITVPGPGPVETHGEDVMASTATLPNPASKPPPLVPPDNEDRSVAERGRGEEGDGDGDEDELVGRRATSNDPYSNLDGAFRNYLQDEPRPLHHGRNADD